MNQTCPDIRASLALFVAVLLFWSLPAVAQDEPTENYANPSQNQLDLYTEGRTAFQEGDYRQAVEYFQASLQVGEMNITYLNLGRAFFKAGQCEDAASAYDKVASSPQVRDPSPVQVLSRLKAYRKDLETGCPGTLLVTCTHPEIEIALDNAPRQPCPGQALSLAPGDHVVVGHLGNATQTYEVSISASSKSRLTIDLKPTVAVPDKPIEPVPETNANATLGWIQLGVSAASLGGGIFFYFQTKAVFEDAERLGRDGDDREGFDTRVSEVRTLRAVSTALYGLSLATLVSGSVFLWVLDDTDEANPERTGLQILISPTSIGVSGHF